MLTKEEENKVIEKAFGKKFSSEELNIICCDEPIPFDIYDGYAVCYDFNGKRYDMSYPTMKAVKDCSGIAEAIVDYIGDIEEKDITPLHSLITFSKLYINGVEFKEEEGSNG